MKYGHFSKDGLEYVITDPVLPRPWINYLTNEKYCAIISNCAGGYSFYRDCRTDRILRWGPDFRFFDRPGRYIYAREIRNPKSEIRNPNVWSLTYQPIRKKPDFYQCRHGLGYTTIETKNFGLRSESTYFVPNEDDCEIWLIKLTNETKKDKSLELYPYVEWLIGDYHQEIRYKNIMNLYNRIWFDESHQAILAKKTAFWQDLNIQPFKFHGFFASSLPVKGYATQKYAFLGKYNNEEKPEMVLSGNFKTVPFCSGEDGIACFKHSINLKPGQSKEFVIVLGQSEGIPNITKTLAKYRDLALAKKELESVKGLWRSRILDNIIVETPDKDLNIMANIWVKYQLYICNLWSRSPSYSHEGSGGRGYRDSCQDSESIVSINHDLTKKRIFQLASLIRKDGTSAPGWSETSGAAKFRPNKDHQIWLTTTVAAYIKETGDKSILLEYVSYLKDNWIGGWVQDPNYHGGSNTDGEGTIFEHLEKNLNFTFNDVGERGLPKIGHADWNDAIDAAGKKGKGESVWLAVALVRSLKNFADLAKLVGEAALAKEFLQKAKTMSERVNEICWDGAWYTRGYTDEGFCYGTSKNKEGKIFINPQSWAIMSGVAQGERLKKVVSSVDKYLNGKYGLTLFSPAYSTYDSRLGRISMFSEGTKENAAVFCHASTFMIVAYLMAGYGNKGYEAISKIMPNKQADYDLYKTEPYVYAEYLVGPEHPYLYGEGAFTWVTGSSGWSFMALTEWLIGARREFDGLLIDPCVPSKWKEFKIRRPFRGAIYDIRVRNPKGLEKGVKEVFVDGKKISGNIIRPHSDGRNHSVEVLMG